MIDDFNNCCVKSVEKEEMDVSRNEKRIGY
jgi:hypothetical protein